MSGTVSFWAVEFDDAHKLMRLMRRFAMAQRGRKAEFLRARGLQPGQDVVLMELSLRGSASQNELARAAEVDEPSVGRTIRRLQRNGLVERREDPADARRRVVTMTPAGEALIPEIKRMYVEVATEAIGGFDDMGFLIRHLTDLSERLGRAPAQTPEPELPSTP